MKKKYLNIVILLLISVLGMSANSLKEAKNLYLKGEYAQAKPLFEKEYKRKPKDASINHWLGVCLYETGNHNSAIKYFKFADSKDVLESSRYLAKIYIESYDFKNGLDMYERYRNLLIESEKEMSDVAEREYNRAKIAKSMFDHVEKIVIIDSIQVEKSQFFTHYRISPESGSLLMSSVLIGGGENSVAYCNQNGDKMMWSMKGEDGKFQICESSKLLDDSWESPHILRGNLNNGGDAQYPYLMQDGTTLYYASNGEGTIGGYDIFMTRKDSETGEYLRPQNVGMPYNSYFDDYLLVLDDVSGLGWWATDRNRADNKLTIYVFVRNNIRENYDINEENLKSYAQITNYRATWGDKDYTDLVRKIRTLNTNAFSTNNDFIFGIGKGLIYTSFSDFKSEEAAELMCELLEMYGKLDEKCIMLKQNRVQYHENKSEDLKTEIISLEKQIERLRIDIYKKENSIRNIEQNI